MYETYVNSFCSLSILLARHPVYNPSKHKRESMKSEDGETYGSAIGESAPESSYGCEE